jgi:hypothetical protein
LSSWVVDILVLNSKVRISIARRITALDVDAISALLEESWSPTWDIAVFSARSRTELGICDIVAVFERTDENIANSFGGKAIL